MENVKHFVFDLTCDVTGDLEVKFLNFIWKVSSRPFHCRLNFPPTCWFPRKMGGPLRPPPQQRVGAGLGPAGRGLIRRKKCSTLEADIRTNCIRMNFLLYLINWRFLYPCMTFIYLFHLSKRLSLITSPKYWKCSHFYSRSPFLLLISKLTKEAP